MKIYNLIEKTFLFFIIMLSASHSLAFNPYFDTEVTIELCPEYAYGGITVEVYYSSINSNGPQLAQIISSSYDLPNNLYKPVVRLPSYLGTNKFSIYGICKSTTSTSANSNTLSISNCDKLALYDTDFDGITNDQEDTNCDNFYSPGDFSNPDNVDSDGDGVADLVEKINSTSPSNPGESPRPIISASSAYDPDGDNLSNPIVWRPASGNWYVKNISGAPTTFNFGQKGDIPFTYQDLNHISDVGVIRQSGNDLVWYFRGSGFPNSGEHNSNGFKFGNFGDNIILGAWEKPGVTNPAVARLVAGKWEYYILLSDKTIRRETWGSNGDLPKPQDLDGDGLLDLSVFRPSNQTTYVKYNNNSQVTYVFGTGTSDYTPKGDYTGDNKEDISFWEPTTGLFYSLTSNNGFNTTQALVKNPLYYKELSLGEFFKDVPLSWNFNGTKSLFTVVNHSTGIRKYYPNNDPNQTLQNFQWGLAGDFQG